MFGGSRLRLALVPLVILVWTTFVIFGGAMYVSGSAELDQGQAVKTGLGLCAATIALIYGGIARVPAPPAPVRMASPVLRSSPARSHATAPRVARRLPDLQTPPLLQVFRI